MNVTEAEMEVLLSVAGVDITAKDGSMWVAHVAITSMSLLCIYMGAYAGLHEKEAEQMKQSDAMKFPVVAGSFLLFLYACFKLLPREVVNQLLMLYILGVGIFAVASTVSLVLRSLVPSSWYNADVEYEYSFHWDGFSFLDFDITLDALDFPALLVTLALEVWYAQTKHWMANNLIGIAFAVQGIQFLDAGAYTTAAMLLGGLFFYDIYFVFFTEVMVTVAINFDGPIKLVFPRNMLVAGAEPKMTLLGLGDIVLPGMFIALMLKFDYALAREKLLGVPLIGSKAAKEAKEAQKKRNKGSKKEDSKKEAQKDSEEEKLPFSAFYFWWGMVGWTVGMIVTIVVMHVFKSAQPALLYLVPTCYLFSMVPAAASGQFGTLWNFTTVEEEEEEEEEKEQTDQKDKKKATSGKGNKGSNNGKEEEGKKSK